MSLGLSDSEYPITNVPGHTSTKLNSEFGNLSPCRTKPQDGNKITTVPM